MYKMKNTKQLAKLIHDWRNGKTHETLFTMNSIIMSFPELQAGREITTISEDVKNIYIQTGFRVEPCGVGWTINK